jgi:selenoprotein W-related protein
LAAAIKKATGAAVELIEGGGGVFDVRLDDRLIYSKHETGRFPDDQEILSQLTPSS